MSTKKCQQKDEEETQMKKYIVTLTPEERERVVRRDVFCLSNPGRPTGSLRHSGKRRRHAYF